MNEQPYFHEIEIPPVPAESRLPAKNKAGPRRIFLTAALLLACLICLAAVVLLSPGIRANRQNQAVIPVTGMDPPAAPTAKTGKTVSGSEYRAEAEQRLGLCTDSFESIYTLEKIAVRQPDLLQSDNWRTDAGKAMHSFQDDCSQLGSLPAAPSFYKEFDHWLKLAAGEVTPAADGMSKVLDRRDPVGMLPVMDHMAKFVEYLQNAEDVLNGLGKRKEI